MLMLRDAFSANSQVPRVPLLRDDDTNEILEMDVDSPDWAEATLEEEDEHDIGFKANVFFEEPHVTQISTNTDWNDRWWCSTSNYDSFSAQPAKNCHGECNETTSKYETLGCITSSDWRDHNLWHPRRQNRPSISLFPGFWGMHFIEPRKLLGTAAFGIFEAELDASCTATSVRQSCVLDTFSSGSVFVIPSGTCKGDLMIANAGQKEISILHLNPDNTCQVNADTSPKMTTLIDGLSDDPWVRMAQKIPPCFHLTVRLPNSSNVSCCVAHAKHHRH